MRRFFQSLLKLSPIRWQRIFQAMKEVSRRWAIPVLFLATIVLFCYGFCLKFELIDYSQALLEKIVLFLAGRALSFHLLKMGVGPALVIGFALRAILTGETAPYYMVAPAGEDFGASSDHSWIDRLISSPPLDQQGESAPNQGQPCEASVRIEAGAEGANQGSSSAPPSVSTDVSTPLQGHTSVSSSSESSFEIRVLMKPFPGDNETGNEGPPPSVVGEGTSRAGPLSPPNFTISEVERFFNVPPTPSGSGDDIQSAPNQGQPAEAPPQGGQNSDHASSSELRLRDELINEISSEVLGQFRHESLKAKPWLRASFETPEITESHSQTVRLIMENELELSTETDAATLHAWLENIRGNPALLRGTFREYLPQKLN